MSEKQTTKFTSQKFKEKALTKDSKAIGETAQRISDEEFLLINISLQPVHAGLNLCGAPVAQWVKLSLLM